MPAEPAQSGDLYDPALLISALTLLIATLGGLVALYNARKAVLWKRAELANSHLKELLGNEELVFACRCLDWYAGLLVLPKNLRPLLTSGAETIDHDMSVFLASTSPTLSLQQMREEPRLQIYRTALDSLLGWMVSTSSAIERNLYKPEDIKEAEYWLKMIVVNEAIMSFADAYGYTTPLVRLSKLYGLALPRVAVPQAGEAEAQKKD